VGRVRMFELKLRSLISQSRFFYLSIFFAVISFLAIFFTAALQANDDGQAATSLPEIVVTGRAENLLGAADSATQGTVSAAQIEERPIARPGEILETVPGMIITQHTGGGKANQYYLRGFDLDHGTDFAGYLDGVPLNLPTHAHGQGYMDLNWVIPELVKSVSYEKGVYYADQGDFANAGAAYINYFTVLPKSFAEAEVGGLGYERVLAAGSPQLGRGHLLYAIEAQHSDGAWQVPENYRRINGLLRYSEGNEQAGFSISAQAYDGAWYGTDQIPQRALLDGELDRFSAIDPTTGGNTHRYSVYADWHHQDDHSDSRVVAYVVQYNLDLYSDFTYFLNQVTGDEIDQRDSRVYTGVRAQHTIYGKLADLNMENTFGFQVRQDWIGTTLNDVQDRALVLHDRTDHTSELNIAPWYQNKIQWSKWFRSVEGIRADLFSFNVSSDLLGDSGNKVTGTANPKLSLIFGPWAKTEFYVEGGFGFRTNDARGIFSTVSPGNGGPTRQLSAIVHTQGEEVGIRTSAVKGLNSTLSLWALSSESDTFFDGDVGAVVDADRPGIRYGIEWTNFYNLDRWLTIDADLAYSYARFTDHDPTNVGDYIPQAITSVISAGVSVHDFPGAEKVFGSLRMREFGPRPLLEDASQRSASSTVFNLQAGYHFTENWSALVEILNMLDATYNDNEYYYSSRLKGEPVGPDDGGGYNDHMIHAGEPRSLRVAVVGRF
jgi:hypothetical protein